MTTNPPETPGQPGSDWIELPPEPMPNPTYWPMVLALGIMLLAWGLVTSIFISGVGILVFAIALTGWIGEIRHDEQIHPTD